MAASVEKHRVKYPGAMFSGRVGTALTAFGRARYEDSALGNLVTQAMLESGAGDVALIPGNSLKADLPQGPLTVGNMYEAIPFESQLSTVTMTGSQLRKILERSAARHDGNRVLQIAGAQMTYDTSREPGQRVVNLEVGGRPLLPNATYKVVVDDFLADGGDGYSDFKGCPRHGTGIKLRDVVQSYITGKGAVTAMVDGRIKPVTLPS